MRYCRHFKKEFKDVALACPQCAIEEVRALRRELEKWKADWLKASDDAGKAMIERDSLKAEVKSLHDYWMPTAKNEERLRQVAEAEMEKAKAERNGYEYKYHEYEAIAAKAQIQAHALSAQVAAQQEVVRRAVEKFKNARDVEDYEWGELEDLLSFTHPSVEIAYVEIAKARAKDSERLDKLEALMRPKDGYCEIFFAGLRSGDAEATAFQVESNPEKFPTVNGPTLREAIDAAFAKFQEGNRG